MPALLLAALLHLTGQTPPAPASEAQPKVSIVDLTEGIGDEVKFGDKVTVDYTGRLTNGKKFDSSKGSGHRPMVIIVGIGEVIPGMDEGLIGAKVGGIRKLSIPPELAYGDTGRKPLIPPKSTLVFTVSVRKIEPALSQVKVEIATAGHGPELEVGQVATLIYTARLTNGKYIVSKKELPAPVRVNFGKTPMPPGLALGLHGMKAGEKRTITVPPDLAFGEAGAGSVGPHETIIFEVTLFSIEPPRDQSGGPDKRS